MTGRVGVCIATSGPGATNLVTGLADALLDSVPLVAITGQVPRRMIGTDAFQETPIVEVTRPITKHNYLVMDINDLPRIMKEVGCGGGRVCVWRDTHTTYAHYSELLTCFPMAICSLTKQ